MEHEFLISHLHNALQYQKVTETQWPYKALGRFMSSNRPWQDLMSIKQSLAHEFHMIFIARPASQAPSGAVRRAHELLRC